MSESNVAADRAAVLAAFDQARDTFLAAFAAVPDTALPYLPDGDEYALGGLLLHLTDPLKSYTTLLRRLAQVTTDTLDYRDTAEMSIQSRANWLAARPTGADRAGLLAGLTAAHQQAREQLQACTDAAFDHEIGVLFPGSDTPYPTSPRAVAGWITDHYQEHIPQVAALLQAWQAQAAS